MGTELDRRRATSAHTPRRILAAFLVTLAPLFALAQEDPTTQARALMDAGERALEQRDTKTAIERLNSALEIAFDTRDGVLAAWIYARLGLAHGVDGNTAQAIHDFDEAIDIFLYGGLLEEVLVTSQIAVGVARQGGERQALDQYLKLFVRIADHYEGRGATAEALSARKTLLNLLRLPEDAQLYRETALAMERLAGSAGDQGTQANALAFLGHYEDTMGNPQAACAYFRDAVEHYRGLDDPSSLAALLNRAAQCLSNLGRHIEALPLQREALALRRNESDQEAIAQSLNNLALLHQELGNHPRARELIDEATALTRGFGTPENLAQSLTNQAAIYRDLGRYDEAVAVLQEVLTLADEHSLPERRESATHVLATVYYEKGDALAALAATAIADDDDSGGTGDSGDEPAFKETINVAAMFLALGYHDKAIEIFEKELERAEAAEDTPAMASAHDGLAAAFAGAGRYLVAERHAIEALEIRRTLGNSLDTVRALHNLANIHVATGRYHAAADRYDELLRRQRSLQAPKNKVETLLGLANAYRAMKRYGPAAEYAEQARALADEHGFSVLGVRARRSLALIHLHQGQLAEAERLLLEVEASGGESPREVTDEWLVELYLTSGRYREALDKLEQVDAETLRTADEGYRIQYRTQRGLARLGLSEIRGAVADFNQAIALIDDMRQRFTGAPSTGFFDAGSFGGRGRAYRGMVETLARLALSDVEVTMTIADRQYDAPSAALLFTERMRGRALGEHMSMTLWQTQRPELPPALLAREDRILAEMQAVAEELNRQKQRGEAFTDAQVERFERLQAQARVHMKQMSNEYPWYAQVYSPGKLRAEDLKLAPDEVMLEYVFGVQYVYVFVLRQGKPPHLVRIPASAADLQNQVKVFRDLLVARRFPAALARELFDRLVAPVLPHISERDAVIIVPDRILGLLPFEALVSGGDGDDPRELEFFGTGRRVSYAHSAGTFSLARAAPQQPTQHRLFAIADPIFGLDDPRLRTDAGSIPSGDAAGELLSSYSRLPDTAREVTAIAAILGVEASPPDVLTGALANESAVGDADLAAYTFLHFATHAAALGEPGWVNEPFLALGRVGNRGEHDGLLTLSEITKLDLRAELVVLAACDTGGGHVLEGDGVASLASGFQLAGADSVLLSLWELPSRAARQFMQGFYRRLERGHDKAEALRLTREAMRRRYPDPYYWSVFVLYGGRA